MIKNSLSISALAFSLFANSFIFKNSCIASTLSDESIASIEPEASKCVKMVASCLLRPSNLIHLNQQTDKKASNLKVHIDKTIPFSIRGRVFTHLESLYFLGEIVQRRIDQYQKARKLIWSHPIVCKMKDFQTRPFYIAESLPVKTYHKMGAQSTESNLVPQGEFKVASHGYLYSGNISNCVALFLWNSETKTGGLAHLTGENVRFIDQLCQSNSTRLTGLQEFISRVSGNSPSPH